MIWFINNRWSKRCRGCSNSQGLWKLKRKKRHQIGDITQIEVSNEVSNQRRWSIFVHDLVMRPVSRTHDLKLCNQTWPAQSPEYMSACVYITKRRWWRSTNNSDYYPSNGATVSSFEDAGIIVFEQSILLDFSPQTSRESYRLIKDLCNKVITFFSTSELSRFQLVG